MMTSISFNRFLAWTTVSLFFIGIGIFNIKVDVNGLQSESQIINISVSETQGWPWQARTNTKRKTVNGKKCCVYKLNSRCTGRDFCNDGPIS
ncbi:MAG: hypothetical protein AAF696_32215 [Bacteroidota bacterium]